MKKNIISYILILFFLSTTIHCKTKKSNEEKEKILQKTIVSSEEKIKGYFNNDDLEDYIIRDKTQPEKNTLTIFINNGKNYVKKGIIEVFNDDFETVENPLQNLFISNPQKGQILVGASCCGSFKTTESTYYKFFKEIDSWILYKTTIATIDSDFLPLIDVTYNDFTYSVDGKNRKNEDLRIQELKLFKEQNETKFNALFDKYKKSNDTKMIAKESGSLNFDDLAEMVLNVPINKINITKYNDLAYYLLRTKDGKASSVFLLKIIIKKEPSRIVAYLNIADGYWDMEQFERAKESYKKYDSLIRESGKDISIIPARVKERIK
ncbi:type IV pilus biogenesis/stability protein PilW [Flavobacterium sp. JAS]|uniref:tetratricopeptide repeat protein n=1 Tax=Flavobacterium sp. JAS TaxID=2897329 RepID=UPI001E39B7EE|nr:hypothetical protein [Flavobacterium sp. JAS]MCD0472301.1 hypothetical protein [Flavobacterium sp. JAS]